MGPSKLGEEGKPVLFVLFSSSPRAQQHRKHEEKALTVFL